MNRVPTIRGDASIEEVRDACQSFRVTALALEAETTRSVVGQSVVVRETIIALLAGGHVLLEGLPGLGKTLLVRTLSDALGLSFARIQCTPDLMPADITGTNIVMDDPVTSRRVIGFRSGPIFHQLLLVDEVNRATPKSQSALLEAMQERQVSVGGETRPLPTPFFVMATQNPIEQEGTYPLPEAQLDRFMLKVLVPAVTRETLQQVLARTTTAADPVVSRVLDADGIASAIALAKWIAVAPHVADFAIRLVLSTHPGGDHSPKGFDRWIVTGASPRAVQALVSCAKVRALLDGRFAIGTDDIAALAPACLRHRIVRSFEAEADGRSTDSIIADLLQRVDRGVVAHTVAGVHA
ncbi:MAG: AAA family ATPase [Planctomycetota bacterium]|nr:AAA family ATPase [Planctomycetota bacterium]